MTIAERNRAIKALLTRQFGKGAVTVRGNRGTAYGWVRVKINYRPKNRDHRVEIERMIWKLFAAAELDKRKIVLDFEPVLEKEHWEA